MRVCVQTIMGAVVLATQVCGAATVKDVEIHGEGAGKPDEGYVGARISSRETQEFDTMAVSRDVKRLLGTGKFDDVKVEAAKEDDGVALSYIVKSRLRLARPLRVEGEKYFSARKIRDIADLGTGELVNDAILAARAEQVADRYRDYDFEDISIVPSLDVVDSEKGLAEGVFKIVEGRRTKVTKVTFAGNSRMGDRKLRRISGIPAWWSIPGWFETRRYDAKTLADMAMSVRKAYLDLGYLNVKLGDPVRIEHGKGRYVVEFPVEEGTRYVFGEATIRGVSLFPEAELAGLVGMPKGKALSMTDMLNAAEVLRSYYSNRGYARTSVRPAVIPRPDTAGNVADIVFTVKEGSLTYVRNVYIRGNNVTRDEVIRRELAIYPGDVFDERRIKTSENRLKNLGYFSSVVSRPDGTPRLDQYDLVFDVEEQPTGNIMAGGGYSSVDNLVGFVEYTEKNFDIAGWPPRGGGQRLRLRTQFGATSTMGELSFVEPWFLGRKLSLGVDLYGRQYSYDEYDIRRIGAAVTLGTAVSMPVFHRADLGFEIDDEDIGGVSDTNQYWTISDPPEPFFFEAYRQQKHEVNLTFTRDTRDSPFAPSAGNRLVLSGRYAGGMIGGDVELYGWSLKGEQYFPLWLNHVLALKGRFEVVDSHGDGELRFSDKLYLGGGRTVRGFEFRGIGPKAKRDIVTTGVEGVGDTSNTVYRMIGGQTLGMVSVEYAVPLAEKISLVPFMDAGNVGVDPYELDTGSFAASAGIELRFDLAQFPIKLNYARPVTLDDEYTRTETWGFWIGSGF